MVSGTIRAMLESSMKEANSGVIPFPEISTAVLEKTIQCEDVGGVGEGAKRC